jgi:hypothetical protein
MRFWDSSALVPLVLAWPSDQAVRGEYERDADALVWWGTRVECASAIARVEREGLLAPPGVAEAMSRLDAMAAAWGEVQPIDRIRQLAVRLLRVHALRAADALQIAAAIIGSEDRPTTLPVVTLDRRLALAAEREGFPVIVPE